MPKKVYKARDSLGKLRGLLRRDGDHAYEITRQFVMTARVYAMDEQEAQAIAERLHPEDYKVSGASGHIDVVPIPERRRRGRG